MRVELADLLHQRCLPVCIRHPPDLGLWLKSRGRRVVHGAHAGHAVGSEIRLAEIAQRGGSTLSDGFEKFRVVCPGHAQVRARAPGAEQVIDKVGVHRELSCSDEVGEVALVVPPPNIFEQRISAALGDELLDRLCNRGQPKTANVAVNVIRQSNTALARLL